MGPRIDPDAFGVRRKPKRAPRPRKPKAKDGAPDPVPSRSPSPPTKYKAPKDLCHSASDAIGRIYYHLRCCYCVNMAFPEPAKLYKHIARCHTANLDREAGETGDKKWANVYKRTENLNHRSARNMEMRRATQHFPVIKDYFYAQKRKDLWLLLRQGLKLAFSEAMVKLGGNELEITPRMANTVNAMLGSLQNSSAYKTSLGQYETDFTD